MKKEINTLSHVREARYTFGAYSDNFMGCDLVMTSTVNTDGSIGECVTLCSGDKNFSTQTSALEVFAQIIRSFAKEATELARNATFPHYRKIEYGIPVDDESVPDGAIVFRFNVFFPEPGAISNRVEVDAGHEYIEVSLSSMNEFADAVENFTQDLITN